MSETALLSMPFAGAVPMTASRVLGLSWYSAPGITQRDGKPAPQIRRTKIMSDNRKYYYLKLKESYAEYSALLTKKKALYPEYRKTRDEMQEIVKAQKNVELFFAEEKDSKQVEQIR